MSSFSFDADDPSDAATIVNTVLNKYLEDIQQTSLVQCKNELQDYRTQAKVLSSQLEAILKAKQGFLNEQLAASGVTEGLNLIGETLRTLTAEATRVEQEKLNAKIAHENLTRAGSADVRISPALHRVIEEDPEVTHLRDLKLSLEIELESVATTQPESKPADDVLQRKLKVVERKLSEMLVQKEREARSYQVDSADSGYQAAIEQELTLRERILELQNKQRNVNSGLVTYRKLEEQQKPIEKKLAAIREYTDRLASIIKDRGPVRIKLIPAMKSEARDIDFQMHSSLIALAVPLAYGLLLLFIRIFRGPRRERPPVEGGHGEDRAGAKREGPEAEDDGGEAGSGGASIGQPYG